MVLKLFHIKFISNCALRRDCVICSNRCSQFRPYMAAVSRGTETLYRAASVFMCVYFLLHVLSVYVCIELQGRQAYANK